MVLAGFFFSLFFESMPLLMLLSALWLDDGDTRHAGKSKPFRRPRGKLAGDAAAGAGGNPRGSPHIVTIRFGKSPT